MQGERLLKPKCRILHKHVRRRCEKNCERRKRSAPPSRRNEAPRGPLATARRSLLPVQSKLDVKYLLKNTIPFGFLQLPLKLDQEGRSGLQPGGEDITNSIPPMRARICSAQCGRLQMSFKQILFRSAFLRIDLCEYLARELKKASHTSLQCRFPEHKAKNSLTRSRTVLATSSFLQSISV